MGSMIRAIDHKGAQAVLGLRNGDILEVDSEMNKKVVMQSHHEGEVWGLACIDDKHVVTSCDDNKIMVWNFQERKCIATGKVSDKTNKSKRGGASTLSDLPASQCSRALAYNKSNGHIAVGHNDGTLTVRAGVDKIDQIVCEKNDSDEWIECMEYSPDGSKLAVGSHDNSIYIYDANSYDKLGTLSKHSSFIVSVDWSADSSYIRSCCGAHELLFFTIDGYAQDPSGASNTKGIEWAGNSAKFGWLVEAIFPKGTDGTHVNGVDFSSDKSLIATGDDYGMVNFFRNPCRFPSKPTSLRGHSEHVVRVKFHCGDNYMFSVGGYDQTLFQWKKC